MINNNVCFNTINDLKRGHVSLKNELEFLSENVNLKKLCPY